MRRRTAFADGSALIAYSPAVMSDSLTLSLELAVATLPQELVNSLSAAFNTLAGIPMLLPYAGYLLGAGRLFRLAGNIGHALFDGINFSVTASIDFDVPGAVPAVADFRVLAGPNFDPTAFRYRDGIGLVDAGGNKYVGDEPYCVVSLDGKATRQLENFHTIRRLRCDSSALLRSSGGSAGSNRHSRARHATRFRPKIPRAGNHTEEKTTRSNGRSVEKAATDTTGCCAKKYRH